MTKQTLTATAPAELDSTVQDFISLLKPGVMSLVVFTGSIGLLLAPGELNLFIAVMTIICIAMGSGAAGAINMYYDRDIDAVMSRTKSRPIPAGKIEPTDALGFGLFLTFLSVSFLGLATNWFAAGFLAFTIFFYTVIYTMVLKRTTSQNIVIGGLAGAFPPAIGWAAVTGDVGLFPWLMIAIIFMWTPPHFWALAVKKSGDYEKAKVPMLPNTHGVSHTKIQIFIYSILMVATTITPIYFGFLSTIYALSAATLGGYFIALSWFLLKEERDTYALKLFGYSIFYLFLLFAAMVIDRMVLS